MRVLLSSACSTCQKNQVCTEQLSFSHHPDVLVFLLRRGQFDVRNGARRLAGSVVCDRQLSIGVGSEDVFVVDYHLTAVVHHVGNTPTSGHYTTSLINPHSNRVWKYDDASVSVEKSFDLRTAYILLYKKNSSSPATFKQHS